MKTNDSNSKLTIPIKKFYMISLRRSNRFDRLISNKIKSAKNFERFEAIDSRADPLGVCKTNGYKVNLSQNHAGHFHRCVGAYGCSMSHFELYKKIAAHEEEDFFCILEDDIQPNIEPTISSSLFACPPWVNRKFANQQQKFTDYNFINIIFRLHWSSAAYLLKPSAAQALLDISNSTITLPHDKFLFSCVRNSQDIRWIDMPCLRTRRRCRRDLVG